MTTKTLNRVGLLALLTGTAVAGATLRGSEARAHGDDRDRDRAGPFSNRDFRGSYGMLENGQAGGLPFVEISVVRSDGAGHITIEAIGNIGGQIPVKGTLNCTYQVRPNGMGHMDCHDVKSGEETGADFVLIDGGREVTIITTPNPAGYTYSTAKRQ